MTFSSETVRILFHKLPTETQVQYAEWEDRSAKRGQALHIEAVMQWEQVSEVIIRITEDYSFSAARPSGTGTKLTAI